MDLGERLEGLEKRIMDRFDRADEDRRAVTARVDAVEGRLWKVLLAVIGGIGVEFVRFFFNRPR